MHGLILLELRNYVTERHGENTWRKIYTGAKLREKVYVPMLTYPDEEAAQLLSSTARVLDLELSTLLEDFGFFITPHLLKLYPNLIQPEWRTIELILNTESVIHSLVRVRNPGASPPELKAEAEGPHAVTLTYTSKRRMCGIAKGIIRGLATHFGENVSCEDISCMLRGDSECKISVQRHV